MNEIILSMYMTYTIDLFTLASSDCHPRSIIICPVTGKLIGPLGEYLNYKFNIYTVTVAIITEKMRIYYEDVLTIFSVFFLLLRILKKIFDK